MKKVNTLLLHPDLVRFSLKGGFRRPKPFAKYLLVHIDTGRLAQWLQASLSALKGLGSFPGPVKSDAVSPTARHRCDVSSVLCSPSAK